MYKSIKKKAILAIYNPSYMSYFTKEYNQFFKELAANNHKEWFDINRKRYEEHVKKPFTNFVGELIKAVHKDDKKVNITPRESMFRVNRDIRFSKDKTPYKTSMSAIISRGGRKDMISPGLYFELGPENVKIYGGVYMPDKNQLYAIRQHISGNQKAFEKIINYKIFKEKFGDIKGEKHKIIPKEFKKIAEQQPLIFNKQFYHFVKLPAKTVTDPKLLNIIMEYYYAGKPLKEFFEKALKL